MGIYVFGNSFLENISLRDPQVEGLLFGKQRLPNNYTPTMAEKAAPSLSGSGDRAVSSRFCTLSATAT